MYIYSLKISHLGRHCSPHKPQTNKSFNNKHKKVSFGLLGRDVQETPEQRLLLFVVSRRMKVHPSC